ncbi:ABC transporter substrate-binding protein [Schaalia hyovaginalis]|uniref:ABC transporter substrate-binding protein n=1 Tax=Schaalia hyovaginalis TaxID=29316 RepID=UPI0026EA177E|nr:extracellular solute-binding protein [Schaalia hyovaginalis]MDD7554258.1 extracellular solute-binding protein [Schaalia hyovaginalis]MDY3093871.1 extracellular solute-binding protein [Schaalia hyovaginalis]
MTRHRLAPAFAALLLTGTALLGACSNPAATTDSSSSSGSASTERWPNATAPLNGTTLKIWAAQTSNKIPTKVIEDFEKATGGKVEVVTVPDNYESNVQTKIATGERPDLLFWQPVRSTLAGFVAQDLLQDLEGAPWVDDYADGIADAGGTYDGKRYAALISSPDVEGIYYNKKVFEAAGITELPVGWDQFIDTAKKIKAANVPGVESPLFEMAGSQWGTQWAVNIQLAEAAKDGLWDRINTNKDSFTGPDVLGAIEAYKAMLDEGLYNADAGSAKDTEQSAALWEGKTAMIIQANGTFNAIAALAGNDKAALDETIGFFPLSKKGSIGTSIPQQTGGVVAFKTGDSAREAAARQFLNFWMSEGYKAFVNDQNIVSVLKSVDSPDTVPQALLDSAASLKDAVGSMQSQAIANPDLYLNLANMVNGAVTPAEAAKATQDQFAELAKAQGAPGF